MASSKTQQAKDEKTNQSESNDSSLVTEFKIHKKKFTKNDP